MMNDEIKQFALKLLHANSEAEIVQILKDAGFWDDRSLWRLYGDKEGNFAQVGNQQSSPEGALVEKVVNCVDARLINECLIRGIDPEFGEAPRTVRDAVALFFENRRSEDDRAGTLANWSKERRTQESHAITIAATGGRPMRGHKKSNKMCLTVVDQGEGQSPKRLPHTILSLNAKNKQRVRFVQGKFNMGGSGALRFCGEQGLQLVISRRHPTLAAREPVDDRTVDQWAVTVVRREEPSNKSGEPIHSEFTYLAPVGAEEKPRTGEILSFYSDTLALMPKHDKPYVREVGWGTAIKLYEYDTAVGQSDILMKDGLLYALERLLPEIALPIRLHECRGYGGKEGSFETPLAGLVVRLEDGKGDNLEPGFPLSVRFRAAEMEMSGRIYAFKEDKASTYLKDEGVIFTINGQAHGYLPKSIFTRPKAVGLPRLKDTLLVLVDCSLLTARQREDLFMSSRDRLSKKPIRNQVEREIEEMLRTNPELKRLQQERRARDVESKLSEEKPLEDVIRKVLKASPTLEKLFLRGQRLARPFARGSGIHNGEGAGPIRDHQPFNGRRHPTYFKISDVDYGKVFERNCESERRCRIKFETDVENEYFDRPTDRGTFELEIIDGNREMSSPSFNLVLEDGGANLNMALPSESIIGDRILVQATVRDPALAEPFVNVIRLTVMSKQDHPTGPDRPREKRRGGGDGDRPSPQGIALPKVIPVREGDEHWNNYNFTLDTACHVISDPIDGTEQVDHTFYINVENKALKTEMKYSKQDPRLLEAKFKYGNVLLGLALLHEAENSGNLEANGDVSEDANNGGDKAVQVQDRIRSFSTAVAPVLLPMIDQLSGLDEDDLEILSTTGEDI